MIAQTYPNISNITSLQTKIDSLRSTLSAGHHARTVTFYEDDSFAFQIDENGHQIARIKANDRLRDIIEGYETQKQQIIALQTRNKQLEIRCNSFQEDNSQLKQENQKVENRMNAVKVQFSNLKNKFNVLIQHCRPNALLETFLEQFEKAPQSSPHEIMYKVIEIPVEREVMVQVAVQRIRTVQIQVEIPVQVIREVPIYIDRIVEVEKLVQIERIVEVQSQPQIVYVERIKEVPLQVERVVEVIKEIEVPVEVQIERVVEVERIVERVVQVEVQVKVPVDRIVEKIVYRDVPVEKIVIVEKIVRVEVPVEVEVVVEKIKEVEVERVVEVPIEKIVEVQVPVYIEKITQIPINLKEIQQLKSQLQSMQLQVVKQTEETIALKNLLATQQQLNHQNNNIITHLNQEILQLSANNTPRKPKPIFNATAQSNSTIKHSNDSNGTNHANEANTGPSFGRIKILSTHPRKSLSEALKKHLSEIPNKDLSEKIAIAFQEIAQKLQAQQCSNARFAQIIQKVKIKTDDNTHLVLLQQVQAEKQRLLGEISALRRQNHQIRQQLENHQSNSETEHLIQHLTSQLHQQRNNSSETLLDNQHLKEMIQRLQSELSQKNYQKKT